MNEEYEERLNDLQGRFDALKNKIAHCQDFLDKCQVQTGVTKVADSSDKTGCEIHYRGSAGEDKVVTIRLSNSSETGIVSISSEEQDRDCKYTITYKAKDGTEKTCDFVLKHGNDSVGKDGSDPYTEYYDNGNVKKSSGHPTKFSFKATGFSASVTGMATSFTGWSVSLKLFSVLACGGYISNAGVSAGLTVNDVKVTPAETKVKGGEDKVVTIEKKNEEVKMEQKIIGEENNAVDIKKEDIIIIVPGVQNEIVNDAQKVVNS